MRIQALGPPPLPYGRAPLPSHAEPTQRPVMKTHEFKVNFSCCPNHVKALQKKEAQECQSHAG